MKGKMMKINYKEKLFKSLVSIGVIGALLLLFSVPFVGRFNYSPFNALAVNITPAQDYKIQFDLPHVKPISASQREKAEKNLSKVFGIELPNLKDNKASLSKVDVEIKMLPITGKYVGSIKIGSLYTQFSKITKQFTVDNENNELPSKILLTAYFTLKGKALRANIFIINNGSVLKYASMTVQDKDDNVLAMFTYGKLKRTGANKNYSVSTSKSSAEGYGNSAFKLRRFAVKYDFINDPFSNEHPGYLPLMRTDVMSHEPFCNKNNHEIAMRTWGFQNRIASAYKEFYTNAYGSGWANVGMYKITNHYALHYCANADIANAYPQEQDFNNYRIPVSFTFLKLFSISYHIPIAQSKISRWRSSYNPYYGGNPLDCNVADYIVEVPGEYISDTFNPNWNNSIQWKANDFSYSSNQNPDSTFKGYYTGIDFDNYSNFNAYFGDFSASVYYSIKAGSNALYDWYYITASNDLNNVRIDR